MSLINLIREGETMSAMNVRELVTHALQTPDGDLFWLRCGWLIAELIKLRDEVYPVSFRAAANTRDYTDARRQLREIEKAHR